jgi:hypothetical protein
MYDILQSSTPLPQIGPSVCSDRCQRTSHNGTEDVTVKVEQASDREVEEGPEPISFPEIKAERMVSCMPVCSLLHMSHLLLHF